MMKRIRMAPVLAILLVLGACTLAQIVQTINAAVLIAEQAAAITGVNIPPQYFAYVSAASGCISFAATEQASTDSAPVKTTKITVACSKYTSAALPPGTAQNYVDMAGKLATAVQNILAQLPPAPSHALTGRAAAPAPAEVVLKPADVRALNSLAGRADLAKAKAESRKP